MELDTILSNLSMYTAQRQYSELDALDITVHGQDEIGKVFAPTWLMVNSIKEGRIDELEFNEQYEELVIERLTEDLSPIIYLSNLEQITFTCFCGADGFCHRYSLVQILATYFGAQYKGERS